MTSLINLHIYRTIDLFSPHEGTTIHICATTRKYTPAHDPIGFPPGNYYQPSTSTSDNRNHTINNSSSFHLQLLQLHTSPYQAHQASQTHRVLRMHASNHPPPTMTSYIQTLPPAHPYITNFHLRNRRNPSKGSSQFNLPEKATRQCGWTQPMTFYPVRTNTYLQTTAAGPLQNPIWENGQVAGSIPVSDATTGKQVLLVDVSCYPVLCGSGSVGSVDCSGRNVSMTSCAVTMYQLG